VFMPACTAPSPHPSRLFDRPRSAFTMESACTL
jgi:hypothetical protein